MTENANLAPGLTLRPARWTDVDAVAKLIYDVCEADGDVTVAATAEDMENTWKTEGFNLDRDAFVVEAQDGRLVGYEEFFHQKDQYHDLDADGYIHPQFRGQGIGTTLLRAVEVRARELTTKMNWVMPCSRPRATFLFAITGGWKSNYRKLPPQ